MVLEQERLNIESIGTPVKSALSDWRSLYRVAGIAALVAAVVTPITIAVFSIWPPPYDAGAARWFELYEDNPVLGLVSLDLLFVVVNVLMIPVFVGLFFALRRTSPAIMALAVVMLLVGVAAFFATNPSIEMLSLSSKYANTTTEASRIALVGAGEGLLAGFEGTAFHINYILAQLAGVAVGVVILRSDVFSRTIAWLMIIGNAVGFGLYVPVVGLGISAFAGVILWLWLIMLGRRFLQLSSSELGVMQ